MFKILKHSPIKKNDKQTPETIFPLCLWLIIIQIKNTMEKMISTLFLFFLTLRLTLPLFLAYLRALSKKILNNSLIK